MIARSYFRLMAGGAAITFVPIIAGNAFAQTTQGRISLDGQDYVYDTFRAKNGKDYGYFARSSRWPRAEAGKTIVYVCWENYRDEFSAEHALVKQAISDTWQRYSPVEFRGWESCKERNAGVRITVSEEGPHTKGLGRDLDGKPSGMVLNFNFNTWSESCKSSEAARFLCIKSIAVHEFGHALGLAHEQNRPDAPGECARRAQGTSADAIALTPYDPSSVMNYCNSKDNNDGALSEWDKFTIMEAYRPGTK